MADIDLLQQLRDLHLPASPGFWPLAWGWWVVLLILFLILGLSRVGLKYYRRWQHKQHFLARLSQIESLKPGSAQVMELAYLLKQVALAYYPREEVASLHGQSWLDFLQKTSREPLPQSLTLILTELVYQSHAKPDLSASLRFARSWINQQGPSCMN